MGGNSLLSRIQELGRAYGEPLYDVALLLALLVPSVLVTIYFIVDLPYLPPTTFLLLFIYGALLVLTLRRTVSISDVKNLAGEDDDSVEYDKSKPVGIYQRMHEDAQRTLDEHLTVFADEAEKASRIGRFNGIVLTILVTGVTGFEISIDHYTNSMTVIGIVLIAIGFAGGMYLQRTQEVSVGPGINDFKIANQEDWDESAYLWWIVMKGYTRWIEEAKEKSRRKAKWVKAGIVVSLSGLFLLFTGILIEVA